MTIDQDPESGFRSCLNVNHLHQHQISLRFIHNQMEVLTHLCLGLTIMSYMSVDLKILLKVECLWYNHDSANMLLHVNDMLQV